MSIEVNLIDEYNTISYKLLYKSDNEITSLYLRGQVNTHRKLHPNNNNISVTVIIPYIYINPLTLYVDYLNTGSVTIFQPDNISINVDFAEHLDDTEYLNKIIEQILDKWQVFKNVSFNYDFVNFLMLRLPYDFLGDEYRHNSEFIKKWFAYNDDNIIKINGLKYYINEPMPNTEPKIYLFRNYHKNSYGFRDGKVYIFTVDGNHDAYLSEEINYVNDIRNGEYIQYYPSGIVEVRGYYTDNKESGMWITYDTNGNEKYLHNRDN